LVGRRSTRIRYDGRTSLEKAQEQKKKEDLEDNYTKGKNKKSCKTSTFKHLLNVASSVGVDMGSNKIEVDKNLEVVCHFASSKASSSNGNASTSIGSASDAKMNEQGKHPEKMVANDENLLEY
jgi:hypothetical protein